MYSERQKITNIKKNELTDFEKEFVSAFAQGKKRATEMLKSGEPLLKAIEYVLDNLEYGACYARKCRFFKIINYPGLSVDYKYLFLKDIFKDRFDQYDFRRIMKVFTKDDRFDLSFDDNFLLMCAVSKYVTYHVESINYLMNNERVKQKILESEQFNCLNFLPMAVKIENKEFYNGVMEKYPDKMI